MKLNIKSGARAGAYSAALTAVVIAVVIVVNLIVGALPSKYTKLDTSRESMFTFDEKTESFIAALTEDVTVYHISQEGAEDPYLTEILDRYEDMNSHITVRRIDPAKQPTFTEKYTEDALANNSLVIESRDRFKIVPASDVYYIYCEDMGGKVDTQTFNYYYQMYAQYGQTLEYSQIFAGESVVAAGIDYVTMTDIPKLYILSGHDEPSLNSSLTEWLKLKNYEIETLTLAEESLGIGGGSVSYKSVPEDADMLLITGLASDLDEAEAAAIRAYVSRGGNLFIMSSYSMATYKNLTALAATYGIDCNMSLVIEGDAQSYSGSAFNIKATVTESPLTASVSNIYMPYSHGMKLAATMPEGMKATELLTTTDKAFSKKVGFDTQDAKYAQKQDGDVDGPICLGAIVECEGAGSVTWLGTNYYVITEDRYGTGTGLCTVFANVVSEIVGGAETISVHTIEIGDSYLNITEASAGFLGVLVIGILPLAFIGTGLFIWLKRRSH